MAWLLFVILLIWAMRAGTGTPKGYLLFGLAGLVILLIGLGRATGHVIFWPSSRPTTSASAFQPLQGLLYGHIYGDIRYNRPDFFGMEDAGHAMGLAVQVRFLDAASPPHLALLAPRDIPTHLKHPTVEAFAWSLWYPGSQTRTGWIYAEGKKRFGLELSFLGRRVFLALEDEDAIEQVQHSLETA